MWRYLSGDRDDDLLRVFGEAARAEQAEQQDRLARRIAGWTLAAALDDEVADRLVEEVLTDG